MKINYQQNGITLVELLVTLGIVVVLGGAAFPILTKYIPHYRLVGSSRELVSALRDTQNQAVSKQYIYIVRFNSPTKQYLIIKSDAGNEQLQQTITLPNNVTFAAINLTGNQISFNPSGYPQNFGNIQLTSSAGENITIEINAIGQIKSY